MTTARSQPTSPGLTVDSIAAPISEEAGLLLIPSALLQCETLVQVWRWPAALSNASGHELRRHDRLYFQCSACRYQCSLVSGTVFESSKLPLPTWFLVMQSMTQAKNNVSALEFKRHLGVSYPTAWLLKHKIMQVMVSREEWRQLTGRVEIAGRLRSTAKVVATLVMPSAKAVTVC